MALTDTAIRKLRPTDKPFKLGDSVGLYLLDQTQRLKTLVHEVPY